jgi:hypothetical protein
VASATRLRIDAGTVELLESFDLTGVHALLLKGPAIARWLYPDLAQRPYVDCDLLIAPANAGPPSKPRRGRSDRERAGGRTGPTRPL